ncbi:hypothetical protein AVEN_88264-1 [Araneus ventricosus]|uniref:Uncharacterized protein n=1 Tax=Araneus ventricosus TaxID=182803 RepID=A0A4Y2ENE2_ARAVE|nr:hypothetical protein AVEN_88264-1 [Araneus ventricosus]
MTPKKYIPNPDSSMTKPAISEPTNNFPLSDIPESPSALTDLEVPSPFTVCPVVLGPNEVLSVPEVPGSNEIFPAFFFSEYFEKDPIWQDIFRY